MGDTRLPVRIATPLLSGGVVACVVASLIATPAATQTRDSGGLTLTFGISSTLRSESNFKLTTPSSGSGTTFDTTLSAGLKSETRVSSLSFDVSTVARVASLPAPAGRQAGFEDPTLRLSYAREGANSKLTVRALYNRADLDFVDPLTDPVLVADPTAPGGFTLVSSTGERTNSTLSLGFETGINSPFGMTLKLDRRNLDYSGLIAPSLYDTRTTSASVALRFDLSPVDRLTLTTAATNYDASDATQIARRNRSTTLQLTHQFNEITSLSASVGQSKVENTRTVGLVRTTTVQQGTTFALSASRAFARGETGLSFQRSVDTNGNRDTLQLSHAQELKTSNLDFQLGLTRGTAGTNAVIADVGWRQELPRGSVNVSIGRSVATNDSLQDVLTTRARASVRHEIDSVSAVSFGVTYVQTEDGGAGAIPTRNRSSATITYSRALTEDWDLSAGYEHRRAKTGTGQAQSDAIFVTLGRSFEFRP